MVNGETGETAPSGYENPRVTDYGDLVELTGGLGVPGGCEDGAFKFCSLPPV